MASLYATAEGARILFSLSKRGSSAIREIPVSAVWTAASTLLVNFSMSWSACYDCIRLFTEGTWYQNYGQFVAQELIVFFLLLSMLSVTHYFLQKVQGAGLIRKRTLRIFGAVLIGFQIAVPTFSIASWLVPQQRTAQDREALFRAGVAGTTLVVLSSVGSRIQQWMTRIIATVGSDDSLFVTNARLNATRLTLFTKKTLCWGISLIISDQGWSYCDKNYDSVPALMANVMIFLVYMSIYELSCTTYHFLLPRGAAFGATAWICCPSLFILGQSQAAGGRRRRVHALNYRSRVARHNGRASLPLTDSISPDPPGSNLPSIPEGEAHQQQAASQ